MRHQKMCTEKTVLESDEHIFSNDINDDGGGGEHCLTCHSVGVHLG